MLLRSTALPLACLLGVGLLAPEPASAQTAVESRVVASADDAEEAESGSVSVVGSDLELGWDGAPQTLGMRFPALAVPRGAHVLSAWVQFETDETNDSDLTVTFTAQASDDAVPFTTAANDLTARPREAASVPWTPPPWNTVGEAGADQRSPDLSPLVQTVVSRPGWSAGNALVLFVEGPDTGNARRIASSWNGHAAGAPLLHVEYELLDVNDPPALTVLSPAPMSQLPVDEGVTLEASAVDPEEGDLGASVLWTSSRDGILGIGASVSPELSVGIHTLTAQVQDAEGLSTTVSLDVEVTAEGHTLLAAGDIASCNEYLGDEATAALLDERFGTVLTLGDNVYSDGTLQEFQDCYDPTWGRHKARTLPATGNHDYHTAGAAGYFAYFGAAAGDPAAGWYGFDLGSWHVVVLNSNCSEIGGCTRTSPQGLWLEADLAAHPRDCLLAVWHHPRFSSGVTHGSSTATQDLYEIFHAHGGDLVLSGHDHDYERFAPQDAFGSADATGPRQFVVGTGGDNLRDMGEIQPNSVTSAGNLFGVLALTLHDTSYDWEFVPAAGYAYTDSGSASCVTATEPVNQPPQVSIMDPLNGAIVEEGTAIEFRGEASDPEDGELSPALSWTSDRDGVIGAGASFVTSGLSVGTHQIQAAVEDSGALPAIAQIALEVRPPVNSLVEKRIDAGSDDAEEEDSGSHTVSLASSDLELTEDGKVQVVGLRFGDLAIPRGVRIVEAWLELQAAGSTSGATALEIRTQDSDDAPTFTSSRHDVSDRAVSTSAVDWSPAAWADGDHGEDQRSPSLVGLVQDAVDRDGWSSGNALALIITGQGLRRAESYEGAPGAAPLLHVVYKNPFKPPSGGVGCGIGPELAVAVPLLRWLHRSRRRRRRR